MPQERIFASVPVTISRYNYAELSGMLSCEGRASRGANITSVYMLDVEKVLTPVLRSF